jgi:TolB protein
VWDVAADEGVNEVNAALSPDRSTVAYIADNRQTGDKTVWVADVRGGERQQLWPDGPQPCERAAEVSWSPAGDQIAVVCEGVDGDPERGIRIVDIADARVVRTVAPDMDLGGFAFAWSPDDVIAFAAANEYSSPTSRGGDLYTVSADGGDPEPVTTPEGVDGQPAWSPDGDDLVFNRAEGEDDDDIYIIRDVGTGEPELLAATDVDDRDASWSPNGSEVAFSADGQLREIAADADDPSASMEIFAEYDEFVQKVAWSRQ